MFKHYKLVLYEILIACKTLSIIFMILFHSSHEFINNCHVKYLHDNDNFALFVQILHW